MQVDWMDEADSAPAALGSGDRAITFSVTMMSICVPAVWLVMVVTRRPCGAVLGSRRTAIGHSSTSRFLAVCRLPWPRDRSLPRAR
jgi:hypothetical protein